MNINFLSIDFTWFSYELWGLNIINFWRLVIYLLSPGMISLHSGVTGILCCLLFLPTSSIPARSSVMWYNCRIVTPSLTPTWNSVLCYSGSCFFGHSCSLSLLCSDSRRFPCPGNPAVLQSWLLLPVSSLPNSSPLTVVPEFYFWKGSGCLCECRV